MVRKKIICILVSLMVAVTFMPITGQVVFADESAGETPAAAITPQPEPTFSAAGQVKSLKLTGYTYKSTQIGWTAYSLAKGYEVYRADSKGGKYKKIKTVTSCKFNDTGNKKLGTYKYYKVRAYGYVNGIKKYSKYSSILAAKPNMPAPKSVTTTGATGKTTIKWSTVTGAKKYQVYRATSKTGKYKKVKTTKSKSYTDNSVSTGKKYYYKVRAYRKVGKKKYYGVFTKPAEGMSALAGAKNFSAKLNSAGNVTASWSKVTGAQGYLLQRAGSDGKFVTVAATTSTTAADKPSASGTYKYRVRAYVSVNGKKQYGMVSAGTRKEAVAQAQSWIGCKESNGSHKKIIDVYNSSNPSSGKLGYSTAWCAGFVSAVAIKTGNTGIIPVHSYCPTMLSKFSSKTYNKKYTPLGGDVVFYDWNANKVPDHVGMIEKVSGNNVTAIEGNYKDAVKRRTFKKGYKLLLAYGLPNYSAGNTVSYTVPKPAPVEPEEPIDPEPVDPEDPVDPVDPVDPDDPEPVDPVDPADPVSPDLENPDPTQPEPSEGDPVAESGVESDDVQAACLSIMTFAAEEAEANEPEESASEATEPEESASEATEPAEAEADASEEEATEPEESSSEEAETVEATEPAEATEPEDSDETDAEMTDLETAKRMINYVQEEEPAESADADESLYNAVLVYEVCDEMDIDACVVTETDANGEESIYNEVILDGKLYIMDATSDGGILEEYIPEELY